ncbi:hypothetical protein [Actinokineospora xionganensis]|uniref:Uncharacterized protein n=1 Tax=Actinokineospora xionganensis TaxID=2684470 RepID=A0ABR7LD61_9PSEU|nr:hypothetical protein [Actinokineospora xionganensis]MBC6450655.1 hypothetical protein [Actinokineospora xionganensis]
MLDAGGPFAIKDGTGVRLTGGGVTMTNGAYAEARQGALIVHCRYTGD